MDLSLYLSFCLASFLLALMPGPDNIFVVTESLSKGAKNGVIVAAGLNSGVLIHTLAAATGVSLILKESELAFHLLLYAGVAYLLFLAYKTFLEKAQAPQEESKMTTTKAWKLFRIGITMNLLNPKVSLFFIAFLPQFISINDFSPMMQMSVMGVSFMLIGFITFATFALLAHQLRKPFESDRFWRYVKWLKFSVLLLLAFFLLLN